MTKIVPHQSYMTQRHYVLSYYAVVFSFVLIFSDIWFPYCTMGLCIVSAY